MHQLKFFFLYRFATAGIFSVLGQKERLYSRIIYLKGAASHTFQCYRLKLVGFIRRGPVEKITKDLEKKALRCEMLLITKMITTIQGSVEQASSILENPETISENYRR